MMLIYYKTWIYQCLIKQVKSPSICSRVPKTGSDPPIGSDWVPGCDKNYHRSSVYSVNTYSPESHLHIHIQKLYIYIYIIRVQNLL